MQPHIYFSAKRMSFKRQRVRDPLHNLIEFAADDFDHVMWQVIQTKPFQRLRRIRQLGFSEFVYPGATHTRFAHSLGAFQTARKLVEVIKARLGTEFQLHRARVCLAAALVHDVGHGPFSHAFEDVGRRLNLKLAHHEAVSDLLIRDSEVSQAMKPLGSGFASDVADLVSGSGKEDIYSAVVSSQFDADRLDYMRRDRLMAGTQHGAIDFEWLISNLEVGRVASGVDEEALEPIETFTLSSKAIYAAETYVLGLFQLYPTVYFHKTTRGAEKIYSELLIRLIQLAINGQIAKTGLSTVHPIIRFSQNPVSLGAVQALDDSVIWGSLSMMREAEDVVVSTFARRLQNRELYKCIDVREKISARLGSAMADQQLEKGCQRAIEIVSEGLRAEQVPAILIDQTERKPYRKLQESKGPLNQIMVRGSEGGLVDVARLSKVVAASEVFKVVRAYVAPENTEAKKLISKAIEEGVNHAMAC